MGGQAEALGTFVEGKYPKKPPALKAAVKLGHDALLDVEGREMPADNLEVAVLDRTRPRRKFRRLDEAEVTALLS
jgi:proteasome alpha subunit